MGAKIYYLLAYDNDLYYLTISGALKRNEQILFRGHRSPIVSLIGFKSSIYSLNSKGILIISNLPDPIDTKIFDGKLLNYNDDVLITSKNGKRLFCNQVHNHDYNQVPLNIIDSCLHNTELILLSSENGLNGLMGDRVKSNGTSLFLSNNKSLFISDRLGKKIGKTLEMTSAISCFAVNSNHIALVESSSDSKIRLYCLKSEEFVKEINWSYHSAKIIELSWINKEEESLLISISLDQSIMIWNPKVSIKPVGKVARAHFSPLTHLLVINDKNDENSIICTADNIGNIKQWKLQ